MKKSFKDVATYNEQEKTAISVRDGVLEYMGAELGLEPYDKVFTVFRSPATISNAAMKMTGIPVTDEHVDLNSVPLLDGGSVITSEMIDVVENGVATIAIKNKLKLSENFVNIANQKKELSLGYFADLVPHDIYDFEQKDIIPHHLAIVPAGRCGDMCSFIDRKPTELNPMIKFLDAEGKVDLEAIAMVMQQLPEAIRKIPVDKLAELVPILQEFIATAQEAMPEEVTEEVSDTDELADEQSEEPSEEITDEAAEEDEEKEIKDEDKSEEPMKDSEDEKEKDEYKDSVSFKDALAKAVAAEQENFTAVVDKARTFLDADYSFAGKSTVDVMTDVLATQSRDTFTDSELPIAFKLLQKTATAHKAAFEDTKSNSLFDMLADKEL